MQRRDTIEFIVSWIKDYVQESGQNGLVIGISGGIDSAVASVLAAKTELDVFCVEMPIHQDPDQNTRAAEHISQLTNRFPNVSAIKTDLSATFDTLVQALPTTENTEQRDLALANTRSRLRMTTLYYFAGIHRCLVLGTGNKIEDFGVGFFTKYGDGGVDLSPIADLVKSEVYALAEELNISEAIQKAAPTDGLFGDSRNDEAQLGATYDELEWAMTQDAEGKSEHDFSGRQAEVYSIFKRLNAANSHKMKPIPICEIPEELHA